MNIIQKEGAPEVEAEVIAQSIKKVADSVRRLRGSGLTERAIIVLLRDASGVAKGEIEQVLRGLDKLEKLYLTPTKR